MTVVEDQLTNAIRMIRSYDALVVVGAGVSANHYPMTDQLPPLLWQAVESDPVALAELRIRTSGSGSAKEILWSSPDSLQLGWELLRQFAPARRTFQSAFAVLDADREPSSAHYDLARLVNSGHVNAVISYNWDTCLERAHEQLYGVRLPSGLLHKPHGDAAEPQQAWVLPDEDGQVPPDVLHHVVQLSERPRTLVVLGYSGSDATVVESLLAPLQERWPVVRVSPSASGEGAIHSTADSALAEFASQLTRPVPLPGWKYVSFLRSRNFLAALRGERLRPTDVDACPEFPAAQRLAERLLTSRFATLSGSSGTGKSITAFHAARRLNRKGWRVIELNQAGVASLADVREFQLLPGPVLAVVDDAQAIDRAVVADIESSVDDTHAVLLVSTKRLEMRNDETLSASQAMKVLHDFCRTNIDTVGPFLAQLDDRVGWSVFSETPEKRLALALRTTAEPWLYTFVASGGERRINGALDRAVEDVDSALVLAFICVAQMTSRDAGVTHEHLVAMVNTHASSRFSPDGVLQSARIDSALTFLVNERLIREHDGRIRAAHIRIAEKALQNLGQRETDAIGTTIRACVRENLLTENIDVAGKFWLFRVFDRMDIYRYRWASSIVDEEVSYSLLRQCLTAAPGSDRGVALNLLWSSEWLHPLSDAAAHELATNIINWLPTITSEEVNGYRWILSSFRSDHNTAYERIRHSASAYLLAERLSNSGVRWAAMDWVHVINEFTPKVQTGALLRWSEEFENGIDPTLLTDWLSDRDEHSHPFEVYDLIDMLVSIAPHTAIAAFHACADQIVRAIERDFSDAATNFFDWAFGSMLYVAVLADAPSAPNPFDKEDLIHESDSDRMEFVNSRRPTLLELAAVVLATMHKVDWPAATRTLHRKKKYQIHSLDMLFWWLACLSTDITDEIAATLSTEWLLRIVDEAKQEGPSTGNPFTAVEHLLRHLCWGARGESVVRTFLEQNETIIECFPSTLIIRYPDLAAQWIRKDRRVDVPAPRSEGWETLTTDLKAIADIDRQAAVQWLGQMTDEILAAFINPQKHNLTDIDRFLHLTDDLDSTFLDTVIEQIDIDDARENWQTSWKDTPEDTRTLLQRISHAPGPAAVLAESITGRRSR
ncbi:hypothetical protein ACFT1A_29650 [Rhodococcus sp. NPDC057135]|uniref:hypothetical protein n=1 Tax=Rhodococcus sp. NPDC057135 TaxID=3346028 RepID=UPI00362A7B82